jgi:hypothetical protein
MIIKLIDPTQDDKPKGMYELLWGKEFDDIHDWVERLEMVAEVQGIDE